MSGNFGRFIAWLEALPEGTAIPKPQSTGNSRVAGWGARRGRRALIYAMLNHSNPSRPHEKGVTLAEFEQAFEQLETEGRLTRTWFNGNLPDCRKEGPCNFTTIGGLFVAAGYAEYVGDGTYRLQERGEAAPQ